MKRILSFAMAILLLPLLAAAQTAPEDRYIAIYDLIQQADALNDSATASQALAKYKQAQDSLKQFQADFPTWNTKIVKFRLNYLASKISPLEGLPAETPATTTTRPAVAANPEADVQVRTLQDQLRQAQTEKADLEKQLQQISTAARNTDSRALTEAQERVKSLEQENEKLKTQFKQQLTSPGSANDTAVMDRAARALADAKIKLAEQNQTITSLTKQNDDLQKRLAAVTADPAGSSQLATLQQQLRDTEAERLSLYNQLKEAQSRVSDQLAKADEKIKNLQKENTLLRASLEQRPAQTIPAADSFAAEQNKQALADLNKQLQAQADQIAALTREKDALQKKLDAAPPANEAVTKELATTKQSLKKLQRRYDILDEAAMALLIESKIKIRAQAKAGEAMTRQIEDYKKQLASKGGNAELVALLREENEVLKKRVAEMEQRVTDATKPNPELIAAQEQLATLRAQIAVLEAKSIPYTADELALFKKPEAPTLQTTDPADKKTHGLTTSASELITEAQRLFASRKLAEAEEKYQQVLKLAPNNVFTLANLATIQIERENFTDAEKNLKKAMALDPKDAFSLGVWGNLLFRAAKYDDAFDVLSRAAQLDPNSAEIQNILGITLSHKGQRGAAETALRKALQLDPNYGNAHNNLAVIYITQEPPLVELARWHYQKALSLGIGRNPDLEKLLESSADKK